jgi:hypothetical protein
VEIMPTTPSNDHHPRRPPSTVSIPSPASSISTATFNALPTRNIMDHRPMLPAKPRPSASTTVNTVTLGEGEFQSKLISLATYPL